MGWFKRLFARGDRTSSAWDELSLWDDTVRARVPNYLDRTTDPQGTHLFWPPDCDAITLRISLLSFRSKDGRPFAGLELIKSGATARGRDFSEIDGKGISHYSSRASEDGDELMVHYWEIGGHDEIVILSATVLQDQAADDCVRRLLSEIPSMVDSLLFTRRYTAIETSRGTVQAEVIESKDSPRQEIEPFVDEDRRWLDESLRRAEELCARFAPAHSGAFCEPTVLDVAFAAWIREAIGNDNEAEVIDALGAAFGEFLVREHGMVWVNVRDEFGSAKAVRLERDGTMAFPVESVRKRVEDRKTGFFVEIAQIMKSKIEGLLE